MNTEKSSRIKAGTGDWEGVAHKEGRELGKRYPGCLERKKITRGKKKKKGWPAVSNIAEWPNHIDTEKWY